MASLMKAPARYYNLQGHEDLVQFLFLARSASILCVQQIRCGDLYNNEAVIAFNACAVTEHNCVPQRVDDVAFPVPTDDMLDNSFDLKDFEVWHLTSWKCSY